MRNHNPKFRSRVLLWDVLLRTLKISAQKMRTVFNLIAANANQVFSETELNVYPWKVQFESTAWVICFYYILMSVYRILSN